MKASDYIVAFLEAKQITDVFGYPGGMVTHLMDSFYHAAKKGMRIRAHINYHEQASAFAACGYGQITGKPGVCFATSGPGATNLITGIANAFFDSSPMLCLTGQVNTYESKGEYSVRQYGFQETDIVSICKPITKYAIQVLDVNELPYQLEYAYQKAMSGRPGPVLLDIPMNIQRSEVMLETMPPPLPEDVVPAEEVNRSAQEILCHLQQAKRPILLVGAGVQASGMGDVFLRFADKTGIPVVSSMPGIDCLPPNNQGYGFIGAYGHRWANMAVAKSDCLLTLGSRLDLRQTGNEKSRFASNAKLIRVDIDPDELSNVIKADEIQIKIDLKTLLPALLAGWELPPDNFCNWRKVCDVLREKLRGKDTQPGNRVVHRLSQVIPSNAVVLTDVGQNQVWTAQSFECTGQRVLFSAGHGAMGYALPAAIGAYYASGKPTFCFCGDGGMQMNLQELEYIAREKLPIKIIVFNNSSLGMISHFQEMYFDSVYAFTQNDSGYTAPSFAALAKTFGLSAKRVCESELDNIQALLAEDGPFLLEILLPAHTYVYPKLAMGYPVHDQDPLIDRAQLAELMEM